MRPLVIPSGSGEGTMKRFWAVGWMAAVALVGVSRAGTVHMQGQWTASGPPVAYTDADDIVVDPGKTLTISPGVTVRLGAVGGKAHSLSVYGTLNADASGGSPITFTSFVATPTAS